MKNDGQRRASEQQITNVKKYLFISNLSIRTTGRDCRAIAVKLGADTDRSILDWVFGPSLWSSPILDWWIFGPSLLSSSHCTGSCFTDACPYTTNTTSTSHARMYRVAQNGHLWLLIPKLISTISVNWWTHLAVKCDSRLDSNITISDSRYALQQYFHCIAFFGEVLFQLAHHYGIIVSLPPTKEEVHVFVHVRLSVCLSVC